MEGITKFTEIIFISVYKLTFVSHNKCKGVRYVIKWLINTICVALTPYINALLRQTAAEIYFNLRLGCKSRMLFSMSANNSRHVAVSHMNIGE